MRSSLRFQSGHSIFVKQALESRDHPVVKSTPSLHPQRRPSKEIHGTHAQLNPAYSPKTPEIPPEHKLSAKELSELLAQLAVLLQQITRDADLDECNRSFATFKEQYAKLLKIYPHDQKIINSHIEKLIQQAHQQNSTRVAHRVYLSQIEIYMHGVTTRVNKAIPHDLEVELHSLKTQYRPQQKNKHDFLCKLEKTIKDHPEKTYKECFIEVRDHSTPASKALFSHYRNFIHYFWEPHRLNQWIENLIAKDPKIPEWFEPQDLSSCLSNNLSRGF